MRGDFRNAYAVWLLFFVYWFELLYFDFEPLINIRKNKKFTLYSLRIKSIREISVSTVRGEFIHIVQ